MFNFWYFFIEILYYIWGLLELNFEEFTYKLLPKKSDICDPTKQRFQIISPVTCCVIVVKQSVGL